MQNNIDDLRYPIGKFQAPAEYNKNVLENLIREIEEAPENLKKAVEGLSQEQLDTPYRPGGWTIRQVVHHIPDSHINAYVRVKLTLTEDCPLIKTYEEQLWAELSDTNESEIEDSINLLKYLHKRWVILLKSLTTDQLNMQYKHPQWGKVDLKWLVAQYAWHGKHHIAHITSLRERMNW
jgi:hypothetical protein